MDSAKSMELRFYRFASVGLLSALFAVACYISKSTVETSIQLPALVQEVRTLNENFAKVESLPIEVQALKDNVKSNEQRITWLEKEHR